MDRVANHEAPCSDHRDAVELYFTYFNNRKLELKYGVCLQNTGIMKGRREGRKEKKETLKFCY